MLISYSRYCHCLPLKQKWVNNKMNLKLVSNWFISEIKLDVMDLINSGVSINRKPELLTIQPEKLSSLGEKTRNIVNKCWLHGLLNNGVRKMQ